MDHPFRSAAFGGFNRQDVLSYLEKSAKQAAQKQDELQKQVDALEELKARQEAELAELRERAETLERESEELRDRLERSGNDLSAVRAEDGRKDAELESARRELESLRSKVAALEPNASAYVGLKDRTAGVELDAHRRAQAIQEEAEAQAAELRQQMRQWLQRTEREYGSLRAELEAAVAAASGELGKAGKCLEQAAGLMEERDAGLRSLSKLCADPETEPPVKAPMPLEEA